MGKPFLALLHSSNLKSDNPSMSQISSFCQDRYYEQSIIIVTKDSVRIRVFGLYHGYLGSGG